MILVYCPAELICKIIDYCSGEDQVNLRQTNQTFYHLITDKLWQHVQIKAARPDQQNASRRQHRHHQHQHQQYQQHHHQHFDFTNRPALFRVVYRVLRNPRQVYDSNTFLADNIWNNGMSQESTLRSFVKFVVKYPNESARLLHRVQWLVISRPYFAESFEISPLPRNVEQVDTASDSQIEHWFTRIVVHKCENLSKMEVQSSDDHGINNPQFSHIRTLLAQAPAKDKLLDFDLNFPTPRLERFDNVKVFRLYVSDSLQAEQVRDFLPNKKLCSACERFFLGFHYDHGYELDASEFTDFFHGCVNLKTISFKGFMLTNKRSVEWVPRSVQELELSDISDSAANYELVKPSDSIVTLRVVTEYGYVFRNCPFGKLREVWVSPLVTCVANPLLVEHTSALIRGNSQLNTLACSDVYFLDVDRIVYGAAQLQCVYFSYFGPAAGRGLAVDEDEVMEEDDDGEIGNGHEHGGDEEEVEAEENDLHVGHVHGRSQCPCSEISLCYNNNAFTRRTAVHTVFIEVHSCLDLTVSRIKQTILESTQLEQLYFNGELLDCDAWAERVVVPPVETFNSMLFDQDQDWYKVDVAAFTRIFLQNP